MASQKQPQVPQAGFLDVLLHREKKQLDQQLRSESDTRFDTKSYPSKNFFAGSHYGAAGPSTATPSSPPSNGMSSAKTGTYTNPTSYAPSQKGKSVRKLSSVGATKGSSTDETSAGSGSDTDHAGPIMVKDMGSHLDLGEAKKAIKDRKKYKVQIDNHGSSLDADRTDTHTVLKQRDADRDRDAPSPPDRDIEAFNNKSRMVVPPGSKKAKFVAQLIGLSLVAFLGSLLFALLQGDGDNSEAISYTLIAMLAVSVVGLPIAVVRTHGENPRGAHCLFSVGMVFVAGMASMLALSIGRSATECNSVLLVVLVLSILLRSELDTLLLWL